MLKKLKNWLKNNDGVTAVEYGLIAAGLAVAISAAIFTFGDEMASNFQDSSDRVAERPD